jgi:hypothetical protein
VVIICTVEGMVIRINWSTVRKIGYHPAPRPKNEPEAEFKFDGTIE